MKLTQLAQRVFDGEDREQDELKDFIDSIDCSDGFWYGLTKGGYIKPESIIEGKDLERLLKAIKLVEKFEAIWDQISSEM